MNNKRCLITGCAGLIGSHMAEYLIAKGYDVYGIDNLSGGYQENIPEGVTFYCNDLIDEKEVDYTRKQFPEGTVIAPGVEKKKQYASTRNYILSFPATQHRYEILKGSIDEYFAWSGVGRNIFRTR